MRRLGTGAANGTMENSMWSFSVSAVEGSTLMPKPPATMCRMVLSELPCKVFASPATRCFAANSRQEPSTLSRIQFPSVSSSTFSSAMSAVETESRSSNGCPLGTMTKNGSSYNGMVSTPVSAYGSATTIASTSARLSISVSAAV